MSSFLRSLGVLCFVFGAVDFLLALIFNIDITGFKYSPVVAGLIGEGFWWLANKIAPAPAEENIEAEIEESAEE